MKTLIRVGMPVLVLMLAGCSLVGHTLEPAPQKSDVRAQLSVGYSLLYQEANGIPKLDWLLKFKDKPQEMGRMTQELVHFYQQLADTLQRLSMQYPAVHIDATTMPDIEGAMRKAIGADEAKDFAPLIGKTGTDFEREALLMFYDALNEQRHLVAEMRKREPDPQLRNFLETTQGQLDSHYTRVGALLNRRYFTH